MGVSTALPLYVAAHWPDVDPQRNATVMAHLQASGFKVCVYVRGSCRCLEVNYPCLCADGTGVSWQCMQAGLMSWLNGQFVSPAVPTERLNLHRTGTSCKFDGKLGVDLCASHTAPLTPA